MIERIARMKIRWFALSGGDSKWEGGECREKVVSFLLVRCYRQVVIFCPPEARPFQRASDHVSSSYGKLQVGNWDEVQKASIDHRTTNVMSSRVARHRKGLSCT